ncbi:MAG: DUF3800 domain-containing protein [Nitrosotalea sp.]
MPVVNVFVDEAGDLGFSQNSTRSFVLSYVIMINDTPLFIRNKVRRLLKNINTRRRIRGKAEEFKFSNDEHATRERFLRKIKTFDLSLGTVAVMKDSVKDSLKGNQTILYNYLAIDYVIKTIVNSYLKPWVPYNEIHYTIDRSLSQKAIKHFDEYCEEKISYVKKNRQFKGDIIVKIKHVDSRNDVCLQIADYISGSVFSKSERLDNRYYDLIKEKLKHKDQWDWHNRINW